MQILSNTIPVLVLLIGAWVIVSYVLDHIGSNARQQRPVSGTQLRAYERLALLLERTTPDYMLSQMDLQQLSVHEAQLQMIQTIRLEFDHNLSQQVYVSEEVWRQIISARDQMVAFILTITQQVPNGISTADYAKAITTAYHNNGDTPHEIALSALRKEAQRIL